MSVKDLENKFMVVRFYDKREHIWLIKEVILYDSMDNTFMVKGYDVSDNDTDWFIMSPSGIKKILKGEPVGGHRLL